MPLPAAILLDPGSEIKPAWAVFNRAWYLHTYPQAATACAGQPEAAALAYYLKTGAALGHSPSPLFDEGFYLARNPEVAELVRAGHYASGFDHFCRYGHRALSPHWLFDDFLYASLYEDMTLENLDQHRCHGRYDHWLKSGQRECRMAQFLFDAAFYRRQAVEAGVPESELDAAGPYTHFLYRLGAAQPELAASIYFDPAWYLETTPGAREDIAAGRYNSALHHYLCSEEPAQLDPVPEFSERFYREANPDVTAAIEAGFFRSGYQHFIQQGAFELRRPSPNVDLIYYRDMHQRVRHDLNRGDVRDAFAHLRLIGLKENLAYCPPEAMPEITEPAAKQEFLLRARNNLALFAHRKLDFSHNGPPALSVIMVAYNKFALTMLALSSLRGNDPGAIELILVDNASSDDTKRIEDYVRGGKVLRMAENIGFLRACNAALPYVTAPCLLYLNNDVELGFGAIAAALHRLASDPKIGAVGGKIIRVHGGLQEAGSIIWQDGTTTGYMRDASPLAGEANFLRDVDYCSAVFLLCRSALVRRLAGFDEAFSPAYYEDADLCVRLIAAGYRVVYDPAVTLRHLEFGSAATTEASMALMRRGRRIFKLKHKDFLQTRPKPGAANIIHARARNEKRRRVLFIEDTVPIRRLGSGFVRANDCVHAITAAGYAITIFPINGAPHDIMSLLGDFPEDTEILHDRTIMDLAALLRARQDYFHAVWISRTHNLQRTLPIFESCGIYGKKIPFILDTEAVVTARAAALHKLQEKPGNFAFQPALRAEFAGARICRHITAVNDTEVAMLKSIGLARATRLGTCREPAATENPFGARAGLLFVAAIHEQDSPNLDALSWYAAHILPALAAEFAGAPPVLHVVGHAAPGIDLGAFANHPCIRLHGAAGDLRPYYNAARLFIAPTRFAAGTPYKIYETAAFGLPCVATELLAGQLGWTETEILAAPADNPQAFARQIARLYRSEPLWAGLRANALNRITKENTRAEFNKTVASILRQALYKSDGQRLAVVS